MNKRMLSLLLAGMMTVAVTAGCGGGDAGDTDASDDQNTADQSSADLSGTEDDGSGSEITGDQSDSVIDMNEDPYEVAIQIVTLPGTSVDNEAELEAAVNEITLPAINCTVDLQFVWISEVATKTSMAAASDEKQDILHVATVTPLSTMVGSEILLDMNENDLLQTHGKDLMTLFGETMESGNVGGRQLAVPARVFTSVAKGFKYNKTVADELGIDVPETGTMDDMERVLYEFKGKSTSDMMPFYEGTGLSNYLFWLQGYDGFGSEASYGAVLDAEKDLTVENLYASDMFKDYCLRMYKWRQDGIIQKDATDTTSATEYVQAEQLFGSVGDNSPTLMTNDRANYDFEPGFMQIVEPKITNSSVTEFMWGIAQNSERPDKAMDFLNFLYSNADVANIIMYGIEGENYSFVDGSTDIVEVNNTYLPSFYEGGNTREMYIKYPAGEDFLDQWDAQESSASVSPIIGYMFDDTDFQTESSLLSSTIQEYLPMLQNGMYDSEEATLAAIDEFNQKLEAAGINDVIAANQEQLDAWLASK